MKKKQSMQNTDIMHGKFTKTGQRQSRGAHLPQNIFEEYWIYALPQAGPEWDSEVRLQDSTVETTQFDPLDGANFASTNICSRVDAGGGMQLRALNLKP
jgi:hypothetical protein